MSALQELTTMSNRYGADANYVLAGGGNTSLKEDGILYVKGSGVALAVIKPEQFVRLSREKLAAIWQNTYPTDFDAREAAALADLMDARLPDEMGRPSVETLLHDTIDGKFVCHLHPGLVNALTCAKDGEAAMRRLFPTALWVPAIMPGYVLAEEMKRVLDEAKAKGGAPHTIFIQSHGIFIGGDTVAEVDERYEAVMQVLRNEVNIPAIPELSPESYALAARIAPAIRALNLKNGVPSYVRFAPHSALCADAKVFERLCLTFTPDHEVYCGTDTLFIAGKDEQTIIASLEKAAAEKALPRVIGVQSLGLFALGETLRECDCAHDLMLDAAAIGYAADAFGGAVPMPDVLVDAIACWEVERYRKSMVMGSAALRAAGKIALVTGGAQGFGLGIAEDMIKNGAVVALADLNEQGARDAADTLNRTYPGCAFAIKADVGSEDSVAAMTDACALRYGGLDVMISNAGIVRAGGLDELSLADFELSTKVNYTAFYLCAKYAAALMKLQRRFAPAQTFDIIQINSKSGLSGSNRNFAYAGAKFGGIGLVQSYALELVPFGIKVNAICPGNFLDGPLWMHPEKGLFVQYLAAGKVPGAKTVEDVKRYYESRVPMNRGCRVIDVVRAILYAMEQDYETGQAIPVTGGQEMLH